MLISRLVRSTIAIIETWLFDYLHPTRASLSLGMLEDLTRCRAKLVAENALLRHQLGILRRQVERPS